LFSAQRKAAWADVARRIAHEIKNPLTPIQLSAERLRRKYQNEITSDPETFLICTDTIIRQVEDIGRMVDEFSSFARMPRPELRSANLVEICRQSVFLERNRFAKITYDLDLPGEPVIVGCDRQQIGRVLTNIMKNAAEAIEAKSNGEDAPDGEGRIQISMTSKDDETVIKITDNGRGFPEDLMDRITEPYVTTREKGTGLGLAIAMKIMEDHGGNLTVENNNGSGATVTLLFHKAEVQAPLPEDTQPDSENQKAAAR